MVRSAEEARRSQYQDDGLSSLRRSFLSRPVPAASTISAVIAPWISVSHTAGIPSSFRQGICCTWHDSNLALQLVPALDCGCLAAIFLNARCSHRNLKSSYVLKLVVFDADFHVVHGSTQQPLATSVPSAFAFFISSVSSGIGIGVS